MGWAKESLALWAARIEDKIVVTVMNANLRPS
jgi:hypothetical protein